MQSQMTQLMDFQNGTVLHTLLPARGEGSMNYSNVSLFVTTRMHVVCPWRAFPVLNK